jgi:hypothetical protein
MVFSSNFDKAILGKNLFRELKEYGRLVDGEREKFIVHSASPSRTSLFTSFK